MTDPPSEQETLNPEPETKFGEFITRSAEETFALAMSIGEQLKGGEVFLLTGDLGAGKTVFAKGLAAGIEIDPADVTSPSFTLINDHNGRLRLYHIDLYRLEAGSLGDLGLEELFEDREAVIVIEWAERLERVWDNPISVDIEYLADSERRIVVHS